MDETKSLAICQVHPMATFFHDATNGPRPHHTSQAGRRVCLAPLFTIVTCMLTKESRINVSFIDKDGEKYDFQVAEGNNLLDIAQANDLEMEG